MATASPPQQLSLAYLEQDSSGQLVAADTVILVVATILVALRVYARRLSPAGHGWDEFLLPPAWLLLVGACVTGYLSVTEGGAGQHIQAVEMKDPNTIVVRTKLVYAVSWFTAVSNAFSRTSVVALYLRVFIAPAARIGSWIVMAYLVGFVISQIIAGVLECQPISYFWDPIPGTGFCFNQFLYYKISGILNILGDIAIMVLPMHTVWTLQASTARKAGISLAFLSGSLGIVASCIRTASFFTGAQASLEDPTWTDITLISWTLVETGMYLNAACLIGLRPLLSLLPKWLKKGPTTNGSRGTRGTRDRGTRGTQTHSQKIPRAGVADQESLTEIWTPEATELDLHNIEHGIRVDSEMQVTSVAGSNRMPRY